MRSLSAVDRLRITEQGAVTGLLERHYVAKGYYLRRSGHGRNAGPDVVANKSPTVHAGTAGRAVCEEERTAIRGELCLCRGKCCMLMRCERATDAIAVRVDTRKFKRYRGQRRNSAGNGARDNKAIILSYGAGFGKRKSVLCFLRPRQAFLATGREDKKAECQGNKA